MRSVVQCFSARASVARTRTATVTTIDGRHHLSHGHRRERFIHGRLSHLAAVRTRLLSTQNRGLGKRSDDAKNGTRVGPEHKEEPIQHNENLTLPLAFPGSPGGGSGGSGGGGLFPITRSPFFDAALTTLIGLGMAGGGFNAWGMQMEKAFEAGYDPALEVASHAKTGDVHRYALDEQEHVVEHLRRREQDLGTGKTTMVFDAMTKVNAECVAVCDAHPDMEVFRLRLGKALNYEYNEDTQTGLFQRRDPREGGPPLDIERALNKLEKVAMRRARRLGRPLILVFNNVHFFQHTEEGRNMLLQLQQRAESWAESRIMTMVFSTDDFWPYLVMRKSASRMLMLSIYDLKKHEAIQAARRLRRSHMHPNKHPNEPIESDDTFKTALSYVGGRLSFIGKLVKAPDVVAFAKDMVQNEKGWLLSQIGLIPDHDDDVMDEQKWSSCSWLLLREFVRLYNEHEENDVHKGGEECEEFYLPSVSYHRARQLMTRTDFIDELDRSNIIAIDLNYNIRPDSMVILQAAKEVVETPGFDEMLDSVRERIDEIESLHRTRELTFKDVSSGDRIKLVVDKGGALLVDG
ncbi:hypothetical protein EW145_g5615 [Phellinidium pouzarii]|uniref:AAA protein C-terminal winged helix domain-containing protein n=1 Tax=Phellinidium pouzarii TaxID=167371 RepID=A0A4S4KZI6_9AGAM|nr:hypothetical protein EW145_g5615 [Phellinidium pouzarii]